MREKRVDLALLILRLTGALLALKHGWGKLVRLAAGEGRFVESVGELGFPTPEVFAWAAGIAELSGILIAIGLLTRVCSGFAAFVMAVAAFRTHHAHLQLLAWLGWLEVPPELLKEWGNPELALINLCVYLAILLLGPGRWSLDAAIFRRRKRE